jgi:hypothetical protein
MTTAKVTFNPTLPAIECCCYDQVPTVAAAEQFLKDAGDLYGGVVYTPDDAIVKLDPPRQIPVRPVAGIAPDRSVSCRDPSRTSVVAREGRRAAFLQSRPGRAETDPPEGD